MGLLAACLGLLSPALLAGATPAVSPNIVLIFCDDMGYGDVAALGNPIIKTPNFDALRNEGVRFGDFSVKTVRAEPSS